ncbi:SdrD B-like domain-containing protein [Streptomyces sp. NPDC097619]|uniref:SpaA isopeptide-forming pilin-related protein n=1 Tax=Streptomyces sp. NPDC097619 TaxID=3157228 RepID=UPI0033315CA4
MEASFSADERRASSPGLPRGITRALSVLLPLASVGTWLAPTAYAAGAGDGSVKVRVVRAVNANGSWDQALEPGMAGVQVRLTDDGGRSITGTTAADGTVTLAPASSALVGGKYRVQVVNPRPGVLFSAFASRQGLSGGATALTSTEEFVDVSAGADAELTTGFWNPADYCQQNALVVSACEPNDVQPVDPPTTRTLVTYPYNGKDPDSVTTVSTKATTGVLYGIGYSKQGKRIFSGALAKRGSLYGPGGAGAVYVTDRATGATTLFTTVPNAGTTAHDISAMMDLGFQPAVGKESLGDVEVSEDGKELYVVNLADRRLYTYDATPATAAAPKASYAIPDPGCAAAGDWRPFGLGVQDGVVYVGGVCSAQSTGAKSDLRAVVSTFDPASGTFTGDVMNQPLTFPRGPAFYRSVCPGVGWFPWQDTTPRTQDGVNCVADSIANPMPELADIVVDTNGDLILSFRDRFGDQSGREVRMWPEEPGLYDVAAGGDLNRACPGAGDLFIMDGNGGCRNNATDSNNGIQEPDVLEYYPGDHRVNIHMEAVLSGIALSKVETTLAAQITDPTDEYFVNGTAWFDRETGVTAPADDLVLTTNFGKAGGVGDLEVLCDEAPLQIGNRVWFDTNGNGVQDPSEPPAPGVTVSLYDAAGTKVGTTTTSTRGEYYFDDSNVTGGLKPGTRYTIKVDNPADYSTGPLTGWNPTVPDAGTDDTVDSDGAVPVGGTYPEHTLTTGSAGQNNHTYDFGFVRAGEPGIDIVKKDTPTGSDANTDDTRVRLPNTDDVPLTMTITNNGTEPLVEVEVTDTVTRGTATLTNLACTWPDGTTGSDPNGRSVRWEATFGDAPGQKFAVGASFTCTATLTGLKAGEAHTDEATVTGEGDLSGKAVTDKDPWNGVPPAELRVLKKDAETGAALAGAVFELWRETNGTAGLQTTGGTADLRIGSCTTDATGGCGFVAQPGEYYLVETVSPAGYPRPNDPVSGPHLVADGATVVEVERLNTPPAPGITLVKKDTPTGSDANTEDTRVRLPNTDDVPLTMTITNNGTEPLVEVEVTDTVTQGSGTVRDLSCAWPDGTSSTDPNGGTVRWNATFGDTPTQRFAVGASFTCTATLTGLKAGEAHTDEAKVTGEGAVSGKVVTDSDPWKGTPPGAFVIVKKDAKSGRPLGGAVFQLWSETNDRPGLQYTGAAKDTLVDTCATDRQGRCEFQVPAGLYYLRETAVPEGYRLPRQPVTGPYDLTGAALDRPFVVTLTNQRGESGKGPKR